SWFRIQRGYPTGRLPAADALDRAMRSRAPRPNQRPQVALPGERWGGGGPAPIFVQGGLPFAGRITVIAAHPSNAGILYIGTDGSGSWKTSHGVSTGAWTDP